MNHFKSFARFRPLSALVAAGVFCLAAGAARAADEVAPTAPAITVLKAQKACFSNIVEVSGIVLAREESAVRPERFGLKVAEVLVDPGDTVTAGQLLARLSLPEGGTQNIQAPVAGVVLSSSAVVGAMASGKDALFNIIARGEYDLVGLVPTEDLLKLQPNQSAVIKVIGTGDVGGKVRRVAPTVEPNSQLGQVIIAITGNSTGRRLFVNASARASITTTQSCGVAVPLSAVQYGNAGTVVQVVRRERIETRRVEIGLMSGGNIEIKDGLNEGDEVVARAGALLREGDQVRPVTAAAEAPPAGKK
jgi:multidrug efflux pump subunit AcrA (membrane-fusion protein)